MQKLIQFATLRRCKSYCQFGQKLPPPYILAKGSLLQQGYLKNAPFKGQGIFQVAFCEGVALTPNTGRSHLQGIDIHRPSGRCKLPCQRGEGLLPEGDLPVQRFAAGAFQKHLGAFAAGEFG